MHRGHSCRRTPQGSSHLSSGDHTEAACQERSCRTWSGLGRNPNRKNISAAASAFAALAADMALSVHFASRKGLGYKAPSQRADRNPANQAAIARHAQHSAHLPVLRRQLAPCVDRCADTARAGQHVTRHPARSPTHTMETSVFIATQQDPHMLARAPTGTAAAFSGSWQPASAAHRPLSASTQPGPRGSCA
jgi:hypothetical protein